jgi:lipopolysaccharide transport system ATP-binding protein
MKPIIRIQGLGKRYRIGERVRYGNLRESITNSLIGSVRTLRSLAARRGSEQAMAKDGHIWALRDVSLDIMPGEVVGVIGRNGAGKSTLLKILSRITEPTTGRVDLYGRVGSLLEVGTGFHPELTGRENIYLSAAILGMRRAEINRKFDEIVAFAEVERFIDTPVKHYSSGMYVRLAFAVAAHLEPEILLVDEVLAVGDAAFQKKCLGKMGDVARGGRTVLFVSHNTPSIEALCDSCVLLQNGWLEAKGPASELIQRYVSKAPTAGTGWRDLRRHTGRGRACTPCMTRVMLSLDSEDSAGALRMNSPLSIAVDFSCASPINPVLGLVVKTSLGAAVFSVNNLFIGGYCFAERPKAGSISCSFDSMPLVPGTYFLDLWLNNGTENLDVIHEAISFDVLPADIFGTGQLPPPGTGPVFWPATFSLASSSKDQGEVAHA